MLQRQDRANQDDQQARHSPRTNREQTVAQQKNRDSEGEQLSGVRLVPQRSPFGEVAGAGSEQPPEKGKIGQAVRVEWDDSHAPGPARTRCHCGFPRRTTCSSQCRPRTPSPRTKPACRFNQAQHIGTQSQIQARRPCLSLSSRTSKTATASRVKTWARIVVRPTRTRHRASKEHRQRSASPAPWRRAHSRQTRAMAATRTSFRSMIPPTRRLSPWRRGSFPCPIHG